MDRREPQKGSLMNHFEVAPEKLPYWKYLTGKEKSMVRNGIYLKNYKKGEFIYRPGKDDCLGSLYLLQGDLRAYILSPDGREVTLFRLHEGDTCVFSATCLFRQITFETFLVAEEDCFVMVVNATIFSKLTEENLEVRCFLYELLSERFSAVMLTMQQILFFSFDRRLAYFLLQEQERLHTDEIHMTHEQIARYLGSAREVVARMLKRFSEAGLVDLNRGLIRITDREALLKIAEPSLITR